jgi:hypothetical protein
MSATQRRYAEQLAMPAGVCRHLTLRRDALRYRRCSHPGVCRHRLPPPCWDGAKALCWLGSDEETSFIDERVSLS